MSAEARTRIMRSVGQRDTSAEIAVRKALTALGVSYRVRNRDLPGSPDIANRRGRWAIFVNGCFWHGHKNCPRLKSGSQARVPVKNKQYWGEKLEQNRARDARKMRQLRQLGFRVLLVWECALRDPETLSERLTRFIERVSNA